MSNETRRYYGAIAKIASKPVQVRIQQRAKIEVPAVKSYSFVLPILLFACSFLFYANTLPNGYAIDDVEVVTANVYVQKGIAGIPELLSTPHLLGYMIAPNETYRPLSLVFFAVEYEFFGPNPAVGHFFNVLFFGLCVVLLFLFLDKLLDRKKTVVAFFAALLFAAHPIHTEVVDNVKSFDELLCFFFAFLALNAFMAYALSGKKSYLPWGVAAMFLSLLSKETSISFMAVVPLIFFFYKNENKRASVFITIGTLVAALAFISVRAVVLKANGNVISPIPVMDNELAGAPGILSRIATAILVLGYYIKMMFVPYPLSSDYSFNSIPYAHFSDIGVWLSICAYSGLIVTAAYRLFKYRKDPWAFGIIFFLMTIVLFSNLLFLIGSVMSERFTFFASVGFCLLAALAFEKWALKYQQFTLPALLKSKALVFVLPVLLAFSFITYGRNKEWIDNFTLQSADLEKVPGNSHLNYCKGYTLITSFYEGEQNPVVKQKYLDDAFFYLKRSLAIAPFNESAQMEIGRAYFLNKQYDSAEIYDKKALEQNPDNFVSLNNLAGIDFVKNNFSAALAVCLKINAVRPNYPAAYANIGLCYYNLRKYDSGIIYLHRGMIVDPTHGQTYQAMTLIYKAIGKIDSMKKYEAISKKYNPSFKF